jgi:hypothetical protein
VKRFDDDDMDPSTPARRTHSIRSTRRWDRPAGALPVGERGRPVTISTSTGAVTGFVPVERTGFSLVPAGFFDGNPALDVPPARV